MTFLEREQMLQAMRMTNCLSYQSAPFIELYCGQIFRPDFWLQLTWSYKEVLWDKTTWQGTRLMDDNNEWKAVLEKESGVLPLQAIAPLLKQLDALRVPPIYKPVPCGRDGLSLLLTIGHDSTSSFAWCTNATPPDWEPLEALANDLIALGEQLHANESQRWHVQVSKEGALGNLCYMVEAVAE